MRPRRITKEKIAYAYELICSGKTYEQAAKEIRAGSKHLNTLIKKCEREGLGWIK